MKKYDEEYFGHLFRLAKIKNAIGNEAKFSECAFSLEAKMAYSQLLTEQVRIYDCLANAK